MNKDDINKLIQIDWRKSVRVEIFHLYFNKQSLPKGHWVKQLHWSALQTRQWWHTPLTPAAMLICHRNWVVVVHAFNSSTEEEYKMGGDSSQSHSENPGGRIAISDWGRGRSQWLAVLFFWYSGKLYLLKYKGNITIHEASTLHKELQATKEL